ncbi:MAG TPA: metallophosphoesterase [Actinomycetota bacterium]|nr:metallophosphoesterase [Actinomycetota bacterium]
MKRTVVIALCIALAGAVAVTPVEGAEGACPAPAPASNKVLWPPRPGPGAFDVAHFGEAHWNEGQGPKTMPILVRDIESFDPNLVLFSADIADTGSKDRLQCFRSIMGPIQAAGIPYFSSPGNHDRLPQVGPGGFFGDIAVWREVFADMPAPWGDGDVANDDYRLPEEEPDEGEGAATHYYFDYAPAGSPAVRVIVMDNSLQSFESSDRDQFPAVGPAQKDVNQLAFLDRVSGDAHAKGLLTFVVMHQPTQDPRDISNVHPSSVNHVMGKGASPDNQAFDLIASRNGVDGVFLGHIQGNATYAVEETQYFIDGGGGGSPYAMNSVGTDTGYYYGFRIVRVHEGSTGPGYSTYFVPLIDKIDVAAPKKVAVKKKIQLSAVATQPFDPDLPPRLSGVENAAIELQLRQPDPGRSDYEHLPKLAYMWKVSDPKILRPIADRDNDPVDETGFDPKTMTTSGRFRALRSGVVTVTIMSGTHKRSVRIRVTPSR